jgi:anti-anti-sigma factor
MSVSELKITSFDVSGAVVTTVSGRVDGTNADQLEKALLSVAERGLDLLLDCGELEYVSSAGLRSIIVAAKKLKSLGRSFDLCAVRPHIHEAFTIAGFDRLLRLHGSQEAYFVDRSIYLVGGPEDRSPLARNKLVVLRFLMMLQFHKLAELNEVVRAGAADTPSAAEVVRFRQQLKDLTGDKDFEVGVTSMVAEGDRVAVEQTVTHQQADGKKVTTPLMSLYRLGDEKIVGVTYLFGKSQG